MSNSASTAYAVKDSSEAPKNETTANFMREANANEVLNIHTSCDSCSARSTNVVFPEGSIDVIFSFCGHHTRKNAAALTAQGYTVFPENYAF